MTALIVSSFLGVILIVVSLYMKAEFERIFNRRKDLPFLHAVNVLVISMVIASSYYIFSGMHVQMREMKEMKQFFYVYAGALQLMLPLYAAICILFQQRQKKEKKYTTSEDKKVLYIKEKYLAPRRHHDDYHSKTS